MMRRILVGGKTGKIPELLGGRRIVPKKPRLAVHHLTEAARRASQVALSCNAVALLRINWAESPSATCAVDVNGS